MSTIWADDLPSSPAEGDAVWIMSAPGVGTQYTFEQGGWRVSAGMNCPYIPKEFDRSPGVQDDR